MSDNIRIKSVLPKSTSRDDRQKVRTAVDKLAEVANTVAPEGTLLVSVYERKDSYTPIVKTAIDLMDLEFIYNFQSIQRDPSLMAEFTEISTHINEIQKIVGKRKRERNNSRKKREAKKEAKKEEE